MKSTICQQIRESLAAGSRTSKEISKELNLSVKHVSKMIHVLHRHGHVEQQLNVFMENRDYIVPRRMGRRYLTVYCLTKQGLSVLRRKRHDYHATKAGRLD